MISQGLGISALGIAGSCLSWLDGSGLGFSLEYPTISLHHLYVMVNAEFGEESQESVAEEEDSDDNVEATAEFRFVPSDKWTLEATSRLCIQLLRMKIQMMTMEKNRIWKHLNKGRETSLHFILMKKDYLI
ncbi:hypothetical protein GH733_004945 [Mirounga leonina]|nr:hypothetical protein GH733_004945 [Mirounga leonina]